MRQFEVNTQRRICTVDITHQVRQAVRDIGLESGAVLVYVPHTTAAVTINEGADPAVQEDILAKLTELVPHGAKYNHLEGNADAHIKSTLVGVSIVIPVEAGNLHLGTWQKVFFCDFDGPRTRKVFVVALPGK